MQITVVLLCCLHLAVSSLLQESGRTVVIYDHEMTIDNGTDSYPLIFGLNRGEFYHPIVPRVNKAPRSHECYWNPFWSAHVLPVNVQLWNKEDSDSIQKSLELRRQTLCGSVNQQLALCRGNFKILPPPVQLIRLESSLFPSQMLANPIHLSYRKSIPENVTFSATIPKQSNCSASEVAFSRPSFVSTLLLNVHLDTHKVPQNYSTHQSALMTHSLVLAKALIGTNISLTSYSFVREDFIVEWAARVSSDLIESMEMINLDTVQILLRHVLDFLCSRKLSMAYLKETVKDWDTQAFPPLKSGIFWQNKQNVNEYCVLPKLAELQHHDNPYITFHIRRSSMENANEWFIPLTVI